MGLSTEYTFFQAGWRHDFTLPDSWYTDHTPEKPRLYAFFWAPELEINLKLNGQCKENAKGFRELISSLAGHNLKGYEFVMLVPPEEPLTRSRALEQLDSLNGLKKGDCCMVFYSGIGLVAERQENSNTTEDFPEPAFTGDNLTGVSVKGQEDLIIPAEQLIKSKLSILSAEKQIHVFIILDFQFTVNVKVANPASLNSSANHMAVLVGPSQTISNENLQTASTDNFFFEELVDSIEAMGAKMRYANLLSRLQLRYYQAGLNEKPQLHTLPKVVSNAYIFSGVSSGKSDYSIYHNRENGRWEVNAGSLHGIRPSLGFMHTQFLLNDGRIISVEDTYESNSTIHNFEEADTESAFGATLLQNALPKMRVGFHEELSKEIRSRFEREVQSFKIYFIDLLKTTEEASFLIKNRGEEFYLVRNRGFMGNHDDRPVFFFQRDVREFIKQLEYVAQWQAILELENSHTNLRSEDFEVLFEIIEGIGILDGPIDDFPSQMQTEPDSLVMHYRNSIAPSFRCRLRSKLDIGKSNFHVNFLYLDSRFGIQKIESLNTEQVENGVDVWAGYNNRRTMPLFIDHFYLEYGIAEIQEYLLIVLSAQPLNVTALVQSDLEPHSMTNRKGFDLEESKQSFVLPEGDWFVRKIPIRIVSDSRSFEQTVQESAAQRAVIHADDPHKVRWGGQSSKNGFTLSVEVRGLAVDARGAALTGLFNLLLKVVCEGVPLNSGEVAFLVNGKDSEPFRFTKFSDGIASVTIQVRKSFTVAALVYDGTELELDLTKIPGMPHDFYSDLVSQGLYDGTERELYLAKMTGMPRDFYSDLVSQDFIDSVGKILIATPVTTPNDLNKNRWGGKAASNGRRILADVSSENDTHRVVLKIETVNSTPFNGEVAFLLHDSFDETVIYKRVINGKANCELDSYEAFTVGVYFDDDTVLELDLNEQEGYPSAFYYENNVMN